MVMMELTFKNGEVIKREFGWNNPEATHRNTKKFRHCIKRNIAHSMECDLEFDGYPTCGIQSVKMVNS